MSELGFHYRHPGPVARAFMLSDAFVCGLMGPFGSGKSTACVMKLFRNAQKQAPSRDGKRYRRTAIIRQTYPELKTTTIKTWEQWFPTSLGRWREQGPPTHQVEINDLRWEVIFVALDRPEDVKKLLSMELSDAWVNEAREVPKAIVDGLTGRVGRFPPVRDGGCTSPQVIMDTNPPDTDGWWYRLAEEERPAEWEFFAQPGGMVRTKDGAYEPNTLAENLGYLPPSYYQRLIAGKSTDWINVYVLAQYGWVQDGKPVYPEYQDSMHCRAMDLAPKLPLLVGIDFGLTPAAIIGQRQTFGGILWRSELVTQDMGAVRFGELLAQELRSRYAGYTFDSITGDPAGAGRSQTDEETAFRILRAAGVAAVPANTNDFTLRREAVAVPLSRLSGGLPGLVIHPDCKVTRKGMMGGYRYRRVQVAGDERYHDVPDKNGFSHSCEAGQYLMLGAGEGTKLVTRKVADASKRRQSAPPSPWAA